MVRQSPVVAPCLIDTGLEVIVKEYDFCVQRFEAWEPLDPCWLSLRAASNLPIPVTGITWLRIQIKYQVVELVGVVVNCGPVNPVVPVVLGMNVLKDFDLPCQI